MKKLLLSSIALLGLVSANAQCFDVGTGADGPLVVNGTVTLVSGQIYNYTSVTINSGGVLTVNPWNGTTGGSLIIKCTGTFTINSGGSVNVTGLGYRGGNPGWGQDNGNVGCGSFSSGCCQRSGIEGEILGPGFGWAGGYPSGNGSTGGGGGGSYGTLGTAGQDAISPFFSCSGGKVTVTYGTPNLSTLYLGSGGGAGGACGWDNPGVNGGVGGNGGGIIKISANTIINNGSILCNGQNGGPAQPDIHGGSGGGSGGSGGSVYLSANTITNSATISAVGGTGTPGTTGSNGTSGAGGNGGMGRIRLDYTTYNNTGTVSPVPGFIGSVNSVTASTSQVNVLCNGGNNGSSTVTAGGGTPPYTYLWSPSGQTTATATGLTATTYTVTVTDANTCTNQQVVTITEPTVLSATNSQTNVSCNGGMDGSATVTPTGGTPGYTYNWAPAGGTNATATGLTANCYTCTITDANGCFITVQVCPTQPTALTATNSQVNALCNGDANGSATVVPSGGTSPYTYNWMPSGGTNATATGLTATNYTCTITDANGCTLNQTFTITEPTALSLSASSTFTTCGTCCDASATATITGGTPGYTYLWTPSGQTTATATGLCNQTYTVCVTDANNCSTCTTVTISFNVGISQNATTTETMNAFPNPFSETLTLDGLEKGAVVKITNALGEMVYTTVVNTVTTVIDTRKFASGVYFIEVKTSSATETKKIVKE